MEADFTGYATKAGLKCSDGRTIMPDAFKNQDKMRVPLVWSHGKNDPTNILGHAILEARSDGMYCQGFFNETPQGTNAKTLVKHKDIESLSIWADQLVERSKQVFHGVIKEVSLVLSGANPGAKIDFVRIAHSDDPNDVEILSDEAIIWTGLALEHSDDSTGSSVEDEKSNEEIIEHADDETLQSIFDSMTEKQKNVVAYMIDVAVQEAQGGSATHSELTDDASSDDVFNAMTEQQKTAVQEMIGSAVQDAAASHSDLNNQEGTEMTGHNVFEQQGTKADRPTLSHEQIETIVADAQKHGSLKNSFLAHADEYGIENIDLLFPDAQNDGNGISLVSRRMEWVQNVLQNIKHQPFSRIKSLAADITADEARAKGYVKGTLKKDEIIKMLKRVTTAKTVYKKQKLDRDDILEITDLDIVAWLKTEMRLMLEEEIARAILIGDGRPADDEDKIDEDHIRPIAFDIDMYNTTIPLASGTSGDALVDAFVSGMSNYKGSGNPVMYTTTARYTNMILAKDTLGRRLYATKAELAAACLVSDIVTVEVMEDEEDVVAVVVNLKDYTVGADRGGEVSMFDDFDIDYNQNKYLIETRISGALTRPKSSLTFIMDSGHTVTPTVPTFVTSTGVLTVPTQTGTVYVNSDTGTTLSAGPQSAIASGATINVEAVPAAGYGFTHDADRDWSFMRD